MNSSFTAEEMRVAGGLLSTDQTCRCYTCWGTLRFNVLSEVSSLLSPPLRVPPPSSSSTLVALQGSIPASDLQEGSTVSLTLPPRSPEVEGQRHGEDDAHQHQERQPGLQEAGAADVLSMDQSEEAQLDHVP